MKTSTLIINGHTYVLAFDFNLLVRAEEESGLNLLLAVTHLDYAAGSQLRALLYALLLLNQPAITLTEAGALFTPDTLPEIGRAIAALFPEPVKEAVPTGEPE